MYIKYTVVCTILGPLLAIEQEGQICEPYIITEMINKKVQLEECVKKRVVPFISKLKENYYIIFWSDIDSSQYP